MPKSSNNLALARQWEMLKLLPSRSPGITAREVTLHLKEAGYEVSKRTVERDLNELSLQFGIACNDAAMPYGWHWIPGKQQDFGSIDLVDALSLTLAEEVLTQILPPSMLSVLSPKFSQARKKLSALSDHPMVRLRDKVRYIPITLNFQPPKLRPHILESLQQAVATEHQIEVRYAPFNSNSKELRLHPLSLVQRGNATYLLATTFDYPDVLLYAVHRFEKITLLDEPAQIPEGYSVDAHLATGALEFGGGQEITLKAKLSDALAMYLTETPLHPDQKIQHRDDCYQLTAKVHDSWQLQFWILSQGAEIEVLQPKSLRAQIRTSLESALLRYS